MWKVYGRCALKSPFLGKRLLGGGEKAGGGKFPSSLVQKLDTGKASRARPWNMPRKFMGRANETEISFKKSTNDAETSRDYANVLYVDW